jgi:hypothetical protein
MRLGAQEEAFPGSAEGEVPPLRWRLGLEKPLQATRSSGDAKPRIDLRNDACVIIRCFALRAAIAAYGSRERRFGGASAASGRSRLWTWLLFGSLLHAFSRYWEKDATQRDRGGRAAGLALSA